MKAKHHSPKRLSLTVKISTWYAAFMLLLVICFVLLLSILTERNSDDSRRHRLINTVEAVYAQIDGQHRVNLYELLADTIDDQMIAVYDTNGVLMAGSEPEEEAGSLPFSDGTMQSMIFGFKLYYIYDKAATPQDGDQYKVWVRGYLPAVTPQERQQSLLVAALIMLPLTALFMLLGGYYLTRRALRPLDQMILETNTIADAQDFTQRLDIPGSRDELGHLAQTVNRMLERLDESYQRERQFSSDLAHELRTPAAVILAQCETTMKDEALTVEDARADMAVIHRQGERIEQMTKQLLMLRRIEKSARHTEFSVCHLSALASELVEEQRFLAGDQIHITMDVQKDVDAYGNELLIERAYRNLLNNAVKYGGKAFHVRLYKMNEMAVFEVIDQGIGIQPQNLNKIWERFYREDHSRTFNGGYGLGLPMVKEIAELHSGRISVESVPGQGSTFTLALPVSRK